jgi:UPF0755 protein
VSNAVRAVLIVVFAAAVIAAVLAGIGAWCIFRDDRLPVAQTDVIIGQGSSVSDISHQLQAQGVIGDATWLWLYVRLRGGAERMQAAEYTFPAHETVANVAAVLFAGGRPPTVWLTIPEGFTAAQIGRRLAAANLVSAQSFMRVVRSRTLLLGGVPTGGLEGYLFPDTYELPRKTSADDVAMLFTNQFLRELPKDYLQASRRAQLTVPQIVTIASMIEREAKVDVERPIIASVIFNRLHRNMPLEIDATIEYALPRYKAALSFADLAIDSPYNTYTHTGLPPGPISNPGKASLYAAFHPATTGFLYYVYKGKGRHAFSDTLEEQQTNVRRYLR